ncbi:unnamed protein product [Protopolystoma xenopodis]|uniref:Uncharacterized protein n=1 Tax=Protopolystoma xenopodis TaxID=117903 RepID=A0A448XLZ0_9PLAT|nr:unnamed protein product [Protopolystoma xenopodis]
MSRSMMSATSESLKAIWCVVELLLTIHSLALSLLSLFIRALGNPPLVTVALKFVSFHYLRDSSLNRARRHVAAQREGLNQSSDPCRPYN